MARPSLVTAVLLAAITGGCYRAWSPVDAGMIDGVDALVSDRDAATGTMESGFPDATFPSTSCIPADDASAAQIAVGPDGIFVRVEHATTHRARDLVHLGPSGWTPVLDPDGNPPEVGDWAPGMLVESTGSVFEREATWDCGLRRLVSQASIQCAVWTSISDADLRFRSSQVAVSSSSIIELRDGVGIDVYRATGRAHEPQAPFTAVAAALNGVWLGTASSGVWRLDLASGTATPVWETFFPVTQLSSNEARNAIAYVLDENDLRLSDGISPGAQAARPQSSCGRALPYQPIETLNLRNTKAIVQSLSAIWTATTTEANILYEAACDDTSEVLSMSGIYNGRIWFLRTSDSAACHGLEMDSLSYP